MMRRVLVVAVIGVALTSIAAAQRGGGGGGGGRGGGGGEGLPPLVAGAVRVTKAEAITKELKLTAEQGTAVEAILDAAQKQSTAVMDQYHEIQQNLVNAVLGGKDTAELEKALAASQTQVTGIEVDALGKIVGKLDDKQKPKAPKLLEMISGIFRDGNWRRSN